MTKILVTEASGVYGKAAVESLIRKGVNNNSIYALVKNKSKTPYLKSLGINVVFGGYSDYDSLKEAFRGVDKLLFVSSSEVQNRSKQHLQVIQVAKEVGVKYLVYTSQLHNATSPNSPIKFMLSSHLTTEEAIKKSGLEYTILRNGLDLDIIPFFLGENVLENGIFLPAGEGKIAFSLCSEMAEVAAHILTSEGHENNTYDICGNSVSFTEIAAMINQATGKNITYLSPDLETFINIATLYGKPKMFAQMFGGLAAAAHEGELEGISSRFERFLGRKPTGVAEFLQKMYG